MSAPSLALTSSSAWEAVHCLDRDRFRPGIADIGEDLVDFRLRRLTGLLGQGRVISVVGGGTVYVTDSLVDGEHGKRLVMGRRFLHGLHQGPAGMLRTIYADNDSRHVSLL